MHRLRCMRVPIIAPTAFEISYLVRFGKHTRLPTISRRNQSPSGSSSASNTARFTVVDAGILLLDVLQTYFLPFLQKACQNPSTNHYLCPSGNDNLHTSKILRDCSREPDSSIYLKHISYLLSRSTPKISSAYTICLAVLELE